MSDLTYHFPARIIERATSEEELRRLARAELDDGVEPFFWTAEISSNRLDAYFTHMAESSLKNYATEAALGVTFLDSHNWRNLGYGQSLTGIFQVESEISRVMSDFYTVPGLRFGSALTYQSTDDFIRAVKSRLVRDVSIGWYGGDMICDICGNSFSDWQNCPHWPGQEYPVGERGEKTVIATFAVEDAHLAEVSAVYEGATPGAMITRATEMAEAGKLPPETARHLEIKYRIKLPGAARSWPGVDKRGKTPERTDKMDELKEIRALATDAGAPDEGTPVEAVRWLVGEVARLKPLADQGTAYRAALIEEAIAEGVRAMGEGFPAETYRSMFAIAPLEQVKLLRERWAEQAARVFAGGRKTKDEETPATEREVGRETPKDAYRV